MRLILMLFFVAWSANSVAAKTSEEVTADLCKLALARMAYEADPRVQWNGVEGMKPVLAQKDARWDSSLFAATRKLCYSSDAAVRKAALELLELWGTRFDAMGNLPEFLSKTLRQVPATENDILVFRVAMKIVDFHFLKKPWPNIWQGITAALLTLDLTFIDTPASQLSAEQLRVQEVAARKLEFMKRHLCIHAPTDDQAPHVSTLESVIAKHPAWIGLAYGPRSARLTALAVQHFHDVWVPFYEQGAWGSMESPTTEARAYGWQAEPTTQDFDVLPLATLRVEASEDARPVLTETNAFIANKKVDYRYRLFLAKRWVSPNIDKSGLHASMQLTSALLDFVVALRAGFFLPEAAEFESIEKQFKELYQLQLPPRD